MEKFVDCIINAKKKVSFSIFLLEKTYPISNDPRMLFSVVSNVLNGLRYALLGVLYFEHFFHRIEKIGDTLDEQIFIFENDCIDRYPYLVGLSNKISVLKNIEDAHKKSAIEFSKKDNLFMFDEKYNFVVLSFLDVKNYIYDAKVFIDRLISTFNINLADIS